MTSPPGHPDDDDGGLYPSLEAIERDLERLGELAGPYVTDISADLAQAVARIPDAGPRHEAEGLLERLRPLADSHLADGITPHGATGLRPALRPPAGSPRRRHRASR